MTVHLTNAGSRKPPHRGPGRAWTIMAAPRAQYGELGFGPVEALVPPIDWVFQAKSGELPFEEYRQRYAALLATRSALLRPGILLAPRGELVQHGDTLLCSCSREKASQGKCHRVWAADALVAAGWSVVLDGVAR